MLEIQHQMSRDKSQSKHIEMYKIISGPMFQAYVKPYNNLYNNNLYSNI